MFIKLKVRLFILSDLDPPHLNKPRKLLTERKRVGPLPARRLESRHASPRSSDHHPSSSSSSSDSSSVHSSAPTNESISFIGCASPLSTLYPPTTSELSSGDSSERPLHSSSHSAGPSHKRCRSPVDSIPSSMPIMGSLAPTLADLLQPRKRFRDSYSSKASIEEDTKIDPIETEVDMELGLEKGYVEIMLILTLGMSGMIQRGMRLTLVLETRLRTMTITRSGMTPKVIEELVNRRVEETLAAHKATCAANALETENQRQNGSDGDNGNRGNGNGGNGNGRNENPDENGRGDRPVAR
ncbi:hypothetical protein Tco_0699238 [Tanacetum coccineum]